MLTEAAWTTSINNLKTRIYSWLLETPFCSLNEILQTDLGEFVF